MRILHTPMLALPLMASCALWAAGAHSTEVSDNLVADAGVAYVSPVSMLPRAPLLNLALPAITFLPVTVSTPTPQALPSSPGFMQRMMDRFGGGISPNFYVPNQNLSAVPAFGQIAYLPSMGGGMLRRFPQAPETFSQEMMSISRGITSSTFFFAGARALNVAHGIVASMGITTRLGRISVERGELQARGDSMSMRPITIFRLEMPFFRR